MMGITRYCAVATLVAVAVTAAYARPKYVECIDSTECSVNTCCVVGKSHKNTENFRPTK